MSNVENSEIKLTPYTPEELLNEFNRAQGTINKHLLFIYSLVIGLNAQRVAELGIGTTTRTLRAALQQTGGELFSCDIDETRFMYLLQQTDEHWHLTLSPSDAFLRTLTPGFDLFIHDGAHDYWQVSKDLQLIVPMMKQFGIICVHDTQLSIHKDEMLPALRDGLAGQSVSMVHLPHTCGLTVIRVESDQGHGVISPNGVDYQFPTIPTSFGTVAFDATATVKFSWVDKMLHWMRWKSRKARNLA